MHFSDLRVYQVAMAWVAVFRKRHMLLLGLGTGKTIITLTAIAIMRAVGLIDRVLVVAPKSVAETVWHVEAANWSHTRYLSFALCLGSRNERLEALRLKADVTVINVENLRWLMDTYSIDRWPFDMVVLDESSLFKNNTSLRFKALRRYTRTERTVRGGGIAKVDSPIKRLLLLTATPASNGLKNLWSQSVLMDNGQALMRSFSAFTATYFTQLPKARKLIPRPDAEESIYKRMGNITTVLRASDVSDRAPIIFNTIQLAMPPMAKVMYEDLAKECLIYVDGDKIDAATAASLRSKHHQICNGACYIGNPIDPDYKKEWVAIHDAKLDKLEELIDTSQEPLLIGYWFKHDIERILERMGDRVTVFDKRNKLKVIDNWNAGKIDALVGQIGSMSHGLNLQHGGSSIVYFSLLDDLEVHDQFNGRLNRSGQKNVVSVTYLTCGPVEAKMAKNLRDKADVQNNLIDALATLA